MRLPVSDWFEGKVGQEESVFMQLIYVEHQREEGDLTFSLDVG